MKPLRIWLPAIKAGSGADVFVQRLAQMLARGGHEPCVQWFDHAYELMPWRLSRFKPPKGVDLVHANSWQGFAFQNPGTPLVITEHQFVLHPEFAKFQGRLQSIYHRTFISACMRRSYRAAAAITTVSEFCASAMRPVLRRPVEVIHNWIDISSFSPGCESRTLRGEHDVVRLLFVGNPSPWKGADLLPGIAKQLGDRYEVICLGGLRRGFNIDEPPHNMTFLSSVAPEAMPDIYRSVDMALVPTRYEAFGYVALEAMSCGIPVVGFKSAGTAEVCVDGETALLAPPDDVEQLVGHIRRLANDASLSEQLGCAGRARAVALFDESSALAAYERLYADVMAAKSAQ